MNYIIEDKWKGSWGMTDVKYCPQCRVEGKRSKVYIENVITTLTTYYGFYDELGFWHRHDPNVTKTVYRCSRGHRWTEKNTPTKCWCGWPDVKKDGEEKRE